MSIEQKIDGLIKAIENQTAAIQYSALVMASLIESAKDESAPKKTRTKKTEVAVEAPVAEVPVVEAAVVESVPPREVSAENLRAEVVRLVGSLKTKLDENKYAEFTTKLKGTLYPAFKTVNGAVKCLDDTNVMDDFGRGEFLTAIEKLVAEYVG